MAGHWGEYPFIDEKYGNATVFFGGGVLLVALLLAGSAAMAVPGIVADRGGRVPSVDVVIGSRALGVALLVDGEVHGAPLEELPYEFVYTVPDQAPTGGTIASIVR